MTLSDCSGNFLARVGERMKIEIEKEEDGRWIAEIPELPGIMAYGNTRKQAISKTKALALRALADRLDHDEKIPELKKMLEVSPTDTESTPSPTGTRRR